MKFRHDQFSGFVSSFEGAGYHEIEFLVISDEIFPGALGLETAEIVQGVVHSSLDDEFFVGIGLSVPHQADRVHEITENHYTPSSLIMV
jgi:hypothetical protein